METCDRCNAEARVTMKLYHGDLPNGLTLVFCSHHFDQYGSKAQAEGFEVVTDTRADLLVS